MISIIICSINKKLLNDLALNISKSIGIPCELIIIDNNIEKLSITKAYNKSAKQAKYNYLCFIHEDIIFHTNNWGQKLINILKNKDIGLVGVSGTIFKSQFPVNWSVLPNYCFRSNAIQHFNGIPKNVSNNPNNNLLTEVAVVDGLFLALTKDKFHKFNFDEELLRGFHLYDIDLSIRIGQKYKVVVTHEILIEHFSTGNRDINWYNDSLIWHKKHKEKLPVGISLTKKEKDRINYDHIWQAILYSIKFNYSCLFEFKLFTYMLNISFINYKNLSILKQILIHCKNRLF